MSNHHEVTRTTARGSIASASTSRSLPLSATEPSQGPTVDAPLARSARNVATIAERLSTVMCFGDLPAQGTYSISQVAAHLNVSLRTLRFYEQAGLLQPIRDGARRLYTTYDLDQLKVIVALREMEASLGAITALMSRIKEADDEKTMVAALEGLMVAIASANADRIEELKRLNRRIDESITALDPSADAQLRLVRAS